MLIYGLYIDKKADMCYAYINDGKVVNMLNITKNLDSRLRGNDKEEAL